MSLVSALGPNPSFFLSWGTFIQLGGLLGQGPGLGLGPGLDNTQVFSKKKAFCLKKSVQKFYTQSTQQRGIGHIFGICKKCKIIDILHLYFCKIDHFALYSCA